MKFLLILIISIVSLLNKQVYVLAIAEGSAISGSSVGGDLSFIFKPSCKTVNCFAQPCKVSSCPLYPYAQCRDNYCGGCYADYYVNGRKVDCNRKVRPCNNLVYCFVAPCQFAKCPAHPNAKCYDNYCGGCYADFYENGFKVDCGYEVA